MKLVSHNGRVDTSGRHNDRNFDISKAPHIEAERMTENRYYTYNGETEKTFRQIEIDYYKKHFGKTVLEQNKRNNSIRHPERNKTILQYHKSRNTRPEDKIIQVGNRKQHISGEKLWEIALEYQKRFDEMYGSHCKILSMALHMDEETPHVHIRRVWSYTDKDGFEKVGERKALEALGIMEKDPSKSKNIHNNTKIAFTSQDRELLAGICREKGIDIEEPRRGKRKHMNVEEYREYAGDLEELVRERDTVRTELKEIREEKSSVENAVNDLSGIMEELLRSDFMQKAYEEEIKKAKKADTMKRATMLTILLKEAASRALETKTFDAMVKDRKPTLKESSMNEKMRKLNHQVEILSGYIADRGYAKDFQEYVKENRERPERDEKDPGETPEAPVE